MRPVLKLLIFATFLQISAQARTWTDVQGRKVEADLVRLDGENVLLKLKDGREIPFPLAKLSEEDKDFVANLPAENPENMPDGKADDQPAGKLNFDSSWPDRVTFEGDPEVQVISEDTAEKQFMYESANYRYICDARLSITVVRGFAKLFETTNLFCATVPLGLNGGKPANGKHQILLFENKEDYIKAGGLPGSAGVFISGRNVVMVPLESLGVRPVGSGYMLDRDKSNKTLPHELTHQLTPGAYYRSGARGWFSEGIAEYIGVTPYRSGSFGVRNNMRDFIAYVTAYGDDDRGGRALTNKIKLPKLRDFMMQSYDQFLDKPQLNYGSALLITTYFIHMDGNKDGARLKAFLKALREGKEGEEAIAVLLDGRSFDQMEKDIAKAWGSRGVDFHFGE